MTPNVSDSHARARLCSVFVTPRTPEYRDLIAELVGVLAALELRAHAEDDVLVVDGTRLVPHLVARAHPTPADLRHFVEEGKGDRPALVVADRISEAGRQVLRDAGWGWLDRRGHARIWASGLRLDTEVPGMSDAPASRGGNPWTAVGLEVALAAMSEPDQPVTARRLAPRIGRSVGATHEQIRRFTEVGLIGPSTRRPLLPELFWETAAQWPDEDWTGLSAEIEVVAQRLGPEALVRVDERAATLGGARVPAVSGLPARCYLPDASALRRVRPLVAASDEPVRCWVRRAPVTWLPLNDEHPPDEAHPWNVGHPLVCALRIAADPARGREIVEAWGIVPGAS